MERKKKGWLLICFLLLLENFQACILSKNTPAVITDKDLDMDQKNSSSLKIHRRQKRWVGALIQISLEVTDTALTVANALKDGCVYRPMICTYKDEIKKYEEKEKSLSIILTSKRDLLLSEVVKLTTSFVQNDNIYDYVKDTVELALEVSVLMMLWRTEITSKQYILRINGTLNTSDANIPENIEKKFSDQRSEYLRKLGITIGIKALVYFLIHFFSYVAKKSIKQIYFAFAGVLQPGLLTEKSFRTYYHENTKAYMSKWHAQHDFSTAVSKSTVFKAKVKGFVKTATTYIKDSSNNFYKSKGFWVTTGLSLLGAGLSQGLQAREFIRVENEMKELVQNHEILYSSLEVSLANLTITEQSLQKEWRLSIDIFKNFTFYISDTKSTFEELPLKQQLNIKEKLPDLYKLLEIDIESTTSDNILQKQRDTLEYMTAMKDSLKTIRAHVLLEVIVLQVIKNGLNQSQEVNVIVDIINGHLDKDETMHKKIDLKIVLCQIAEWGDEGDYDFYDLSDFRNCPIDINMEEVKRKQKDKKEIIQKLNAIITTCILLNFQFCPSVSKIATTLKLTEEETKRNIKYIKPDMQSFNGTPL
ncbi:uncharacterized protein LOC121325483 isoform X1 [Polyodon spathula]|uniref:uncharacterized protein LOC121325483 isoform X1 n=2 Tax=Polyodon spathula TaxID=7913 RepID=UPI001B7DCABC|nr:uncharacterized protein LOC121325483 isoform X1 [Polyodon spathula]